MKTKKAQNANGAINANRGAQPNNICNKLNFNKLTSDCLVGFLADYDLTVGFSTREEKTFQGSYSWGESSTTLIGSIISGIQHSDTEIPTGINNIASDNIKVYPNPFTDYINIESLDRVSLIEIFDATGNLILKRKIDNENIDLGILTKTKPALVLKSARTGCKLRDVSQLYFSLKLRSFTSSARMTMFLTSRLPGLTGPQNPLSMLHFLKSDNTGMQKPLNSTFCPYP